MKNKSNVVKRTSTKSGKSRRSPTKRSERRSKVKGSKKWIYDMSIVETVESKTTIISPRPLNARQLERLTESRRVSGDVTFCGVKDVDIYCSGAVPCIDIKNGDVAYV